MGMMNLRNLRYFSNVVPDIQPDPDYPGLVDLNLQVEEQGSADVQLGLTFTASADNAFPISFFTRWTERNFLGEGYTFGVGVNISAFEQSADVSFEDGWLMGLPWFWGIRFRTSHAILRATQGTSGEFNDRNEVPDPYESWEEYLADDGRLVNNFMNYGLWSNTLTGSTGYSFRTMLGRFITSSSLSIGLNYVYYDDANRPSNSYLRENRNSFRFENTLMFSTAWDTRDFFMAPQRGFRLAQSISFTGGFLLGQIHFTRLTTSFENHFKFFDWAPFGEDNWHWKFIFKTKMTYNVLLPPLGNDFILEAQPQHRIFVSEAFGEGRGWGLQRDFYSVLSANATISMPLWEPIVWWDVLFLDVFVGSKAQEISVFDRNIGDFFFSVGTGLRSVLQQLPLAIAVVKPFKYAPDGRYDVNASSGTFWEGWRFVVSLSINT
jgi:outer membrane protein insertion porin family